MKPERSAPRSNEGRSGFRTVVEKTNDNTDGYEHVRYVGQGKRGRMLRIDEDRLDVELAIKELQAAHETLVMLGGTSERTSIQPAERRERRERYREALGKIALAGRAVDEIVLRGDVK